MIYFRAARAVAGIVLVSIVAVFAAQTSKINRANFDRIEVGMMLSEVEAILGPHGSVHGTVNFADLEHDPSAQVYVWERRSVLGDRRISLNIDKGRIISKIADNL